MQLVTPGGIWLQKRPLNKQVQPGKWDTAVGGHIAKGENVRIALKREANEEIGVDVVSAVPVGRYIWRSETEQELVFVYCQYHIGDIHPNPDELDGGRSWTFDEIDAAIGKGLLTPNFEEEYRRYRPALKEVFDKGIK